MLAHTLTPPDAGAGVACEEFVSDSEPVIFFMPRLFHRTERHG